MSTQVSVRVSARSKSGRMRARDDIHPKHWTRIERKIKSGKNRLSASNNVNSSHCGIRVGKQDATSKGINVDTLTQRYAEGNEGGRRIRDEIRDTVPITVVS